MLPLTLTPGMVIPFGGDRAAVVTEELASAFVSGDRLVVVQTTGDLLHVPRAVWDLSRSAVDRAVAAFGALARCSDYEVSHFYARFASLLDDDAVFEFIRGANELDVAAARAKGRSTTRLELTERMRTDMVSGLRGWIEFPPTRDRVVNRIDHDGWSVEQRLAGLGVVGFVFEGRPNVFADASGLLRSGNTVVMRIGSDALGTARAVMTHALAPALAESGLPDGSIVLIDSVERSAGWAMFADSRLALAVARGSGTAVAQLGAVARQSGVAVSLHGTGGAWLVAGEGGAGDRLESVLRWSLDRKVCNTANVVCVVRSRAKDLMPAVLAAADAAAASRGVPLKLHVTDAARLHVPAERFDEVVGIARAQGRVDEPAAEPIAVDALGTEWEWETSPELSLHVVDDVAEAVALCNRLSPRFIASLISDDGDEQEAFWAGVDAPFVGDGFTRWVDGQYALSTPELGLSNWEGGRLLGRGGVLSGDSVVTVRTRMTQRDPDLHR